MSANPTRQETVQMPRVASNPDVCGGDPVVEGTRVGVEWVVLYHQLYQGAIPRMYEAMPTLPPGGVEIALAYYEFHRDVAERRILLNESGE